jgi:hypothetical protein
MTALSSPTIRMFRGRLARLASHWIGLPISRSSSWAGPARRISWKLGPYAAASFPLIATSRTMAGGMLVRGANGLLWSNVPRRSTCTSGPSPAEKTATPVQVTSEEFAPSSVSSLGLVPVPLWAEAAEVPMRHDKATAETKFRSIKQAPERTSDRTHGAVPSGWTSLLIHRQIICGA